MPDLGIMTMNDMLENASMIASLDPTVPLIADADTGYGGPIMVARTVRSYIQRGIAGLHIEDQVQTKRCGHLGGKELVDEDTFSSRIRAAVMAREEAHRMTNGDIVIIARTDALQSHGYDVAISRLRKSIELGADVAFLEGPNTREQMRQVCIDLAPTPVLLNMVPGGVTPWVAQSQAKDLGFKVMIYPLLGIEAARLAVTASMRELKSEGDSTVANETATHGVKGVFNACGLMEYVAFDEKAGGSAYGRDI